MAQRKPWQPVAAASEWISIFESFFEEFAIILAKLSAFQFTDWLINRFMMKQKLLRKSFTLENVFDIRNYDTQGWLRDVGKALLFTLKLTRSRVRIPVMAIFSCQKQHKGTNREKMIYQINTVQSLQWLCHIWQNSCFQHQRPCVQNPIIGNIFTA